MQEQAGTARREWEDSKQKVTDAEGGISVERNNLLELTTQRDAVKDAEQWVENAKKKAKGKTPGTQKSVDAQARVEAGGQVVAQTRAALEDTMRSVELRQTLAQQQEKFKGAQKRLAKANQQGEAAQKRLAEATQQGDRTEAAEATRELEAVPKEAEAARRDLQAASTAIEDAQKALAETPRLAQQRKDYAANEKEVTAARVREEQAEADGTDPQKLVDAQKEVQAAEGNLQKLQSAIENTRTALQKTSTLPELRENLEKAERKLKQAERNAKNLKNAGTKQVNNAQSGVKAADGDVQRARTILEETLKLAQQSGEHAAAEKGLTDASEDHAAAEKEVTAAKEQEKQAGADGTDPQKSAGAEAKVQAAKRNVETAERNVEATRAALDSTLTSVRGRKPAPAESEGLMDRTGKAIETTWKRLAENKRTLARTRPEEFNRRLASEQADAAATAAGREATSLAEQEAREHIAGLNTPDERYRAVVDSRTEAREKERAWRQEEGELRTNFDKPNVALAKKLAEVGSFGSRLKNSMPGARTSQLDPRALGAGAKVRFELVKSRVNGMLHRGGPAVEAAQTSSEQAQTDQPKTKLEQAQDGQRTRYRELVEKRDAFDKPQSDLQELRAAAERARAALSRFQDEHRPQWDQKNRAIHAAAAAAGEAVRLSPDLAVRLAEESNQYDIENTRREIKELPNSKDRIEAVQELKAKVEALEKHQATSVISSKRNKAAANLTHETEKLDLVLRDLPAADLEALEQARRAPSQTPAAGLPQEGAAPGEKPHAPAPTRPPDTLSRSEGVQPDGGANRSKPAGPEEDVQQRINREPRNRDMQSAPDSGTPPGAAEADPAERERQIQEWLENRDVREKLYPTGPNPRTGEDVYDVRPQTSLERTENGYYHSPVSYQVGVAPDAITLHLRLHLERGEGVSPADENFVKSQVINEVNRQFNDQFTLTDAQGQRRPLRVQVDFVNQGADGTVKLRNGEGITNVSNWAVTDPAGVKVHEIAHRWGLRDGYVDPTVPGRATPEARDVYENSLMSTPRDPNARLSYRDGQMLAKLVSETTGQTWRPEVVPRTPPGLTEARAESLRTVQNSLLGLADPALSGPEKLDRWRDALNEAREATRQTVETWPSLAQAHDDLVRAEAARDQSPENAADPAIQKRVTEATKAYEAASENANQAETYASGLQDAVRDAADYIPEHAPTLGASVTAELGKLEPTVSPLTRSPAPAHPAVQATAASPPHEVNPGLLGNPDYRDHLFLTDLAGKLNRESQRQAQRPGNEGPPQQTPTDPAVAPRDNPHAAPDDAVAFGQPDTQQRANPAPAPGRGTEDAPGAAPDPAAADAASPVPGSSQSVDNQAAPYPSDSVIQDYGLLTPDQLNNVNSVRKSLEGLADPALPDAEKTTRFQNALDQANQATRQEVEARSDYNNKRDAYLEAVKTHDETQVREAVKPYVEAQQKVLQARYHAQGLQDAVHGAVKNIPDQAAPLRDSLNGRLGELEPLDDLSGRQAQRPGDEGPSRQTPTDPAVAPADNPPAAPDPASRPNADAVGQPDAQRANPAADPGRGTTDTPGAAPDPVQGRADAPGSSRGSDNRLAQAPPAVATLPQSRPQTTAPRQNAADPAPAATPPRPEPLSQGTSPQQNLANPAVPLAAPGATPPLGTRLGRGHGALRDAWTQERDTRRAVDAAREEARQAALKKIERRGKERTAGKRALTRANQKLPGLEADLAKRQAAERSAQEDYNKAARSQDTAGTVEEKGRAGERLAEADRHLGAAKQETHAAQGEVERTRGRIKGLRQRLNQPRLDRIQAAKDSVRDFTDLHQGARRWQNSRQESKANRQRRTALKNTVHDLRTRYGQEQRDHHQASAKADHLDGALQEHQRTRRGAVEDALAARRKGRAPGTSQRDSSTARQRQQEARERARQAKGRVQETTAQRDQARTEATNAGASAQETQPQITEAEANLREFRNLQAEGRRTQRTERATREGAANPEGHLLGSRADYGYGVLFAAPNLIRAAKADWRGDSAGAKTEALEGAKSVALVPVFSVGGRALNLAASWTGRVAPKLANPALRALATRGAGLTAGLAGHAVPVGMGLMQLRSGWNSANAAMRSHNELVKARERRGHLMDLSTHGLNKKDLRALQRDLANSDEAVDRATVESGRNYRQSVADTSSGALNMVPGAGRAWSMGIMAVNTGIECLPDKSRDALDRNMGYLHDGLSDVGDHWGAPLAKFQDGVHSLFTGQPTAEQRDQQMQADAGRAHALLEARRRTGIPQYLDKAREGREREALLTRWRQAHPGQGAGADDLAQAGKWQLGQQQQQRQRQQAPKQKAAPVAAPTHRPAASAQSLRAPRPAPGTAAGKARQYENERRKHPGGQRATPPRSLAPAGSAPTPAPTKRSPAAHPSGLVARLGNHLADWMTGQDLERRAGRGDGANPEADMSRHLGQQMRRNRGRDGIPRFIDKEREGRERHALVERWQKAHPGGRAATYPEQLVQAGRWELNRQQHQRQVRPAQAPAPTRPAGSPAHSGSGPHHAPNQQHSHGSPGPHSAQRPSHGGRVATHPGAARPAPVAGAATQRPHSHQAKPTSKSGPTSGRKPTKAAVYNGAVREYGGRPVTSGPVQRTM